MRRRVRPADADDVVQSVLCAALEAERIPEDEEELRRWITGVARRKIATSWNRAAREAVGDAGEIACAAPPVEERALVDWAEREAAVHGGETAARTLAWMAREGEGESLESIASEANEPAARVRQRVSRLRRWLRGRWHAEIAAAVGAAIALVLAWLAFGHARSPAPHVGPRPVVIPDFDPLARASEIRDRATRACDAAEYDECLRELDDAARFDPAGDSSPDVTELRARAHRALTPPLPVPAPPPSSLRVTPEPAPTTTSTAAPRVAPPSKRGPRSSSTPSTGTSSM